MNAVSRKKGLGRGLDSLLGAGTHGLETAPQEGRPSTLRLAQLQPGKYQPRTRMDESALQELAASIRAQGLIQLPVPLLHAPVMSPARCGCWRTWRWRSH